MTPQDRLAMLDDLGLAVWLMDDGSIQKTDSKAAPPNLRVYCCGFGPNFADAAAQWFADKYGVTATVHRRERNPYLYIGVEDAERLLARLAPYIRYDAGTNAKQWVAGPVRQGLTGGMAFVPVLKTEHVTNAKAETRYDIEVDGTHTFIVNGMVVSNCVRAMALRMAFPDELGAVYIEEEMHQRDAATTQLDEEAARERLRGRFTGPHVDQDAQVHVERVADPAPPQPPEPAQPAEEPGESGGDEPRGGVRRVDPYAAVPEAKLREWLDRHVRARVRAVRAPGRAGALPRGHLARAAV
ncbi:hypothetical protein AB0B89_36660, partial [Sphaerisporangium sp. NPDC049002]|uniref:hypothetical protein n=1 Tax=Sphaerisporangium sp. NPDC049002 TaxID=3155392 RepID=UPI0033FFC483